MLVSAGTIEQVILDRAQQKKEIDAKVIQVTTNNLPATPGCCACVARPSVQCCPQT